MALDTPVNRYLQEKPQTQPKQQKEAINAFHFPTCYLSHLSLLQKYLISDLGQDDDNPLNPIKIILNFLLTVYIGLINSSTLK